MKIEEIDWSKEDEILRHLLKISDDKTRVFEEKTIPGDFQILGIRIPVLRSIAKEIFKTDYREFLKINDRGIFELILLKGLVIASVKDIDEYRSRFESFIPKIETFWSNIIYSF